MGPSAPPTSLQMIQRREGWLVTPDGCAACQRDLDGLEHWASRNLRKPSRGKCKIPLWGRKSLLAGWEAPGGHKVDWETEAHPCSKEGQQPPGLHQPVCCQRGKGADPSSLLSSAETHLGCCAQCWAPGTGETWTFRVSFGNGTGLDILPKERLVPSSLKYFAILWKMCTGLTYQSFTFN